MKLPRNVYYFENIFIEGFLEHFTCNCFYLKLILFRSLLQNNFNKKCFLKMVYRQNIWKGKKSFKFKNFESCVIERFLIKLKYQYIENFK
jgi:hypothetical protein